MAEHGVRFARRWNGRIEVYVRTTRLGVILADMGHGDEFWANDGMVAAAPELRAIADELDRLKERA